MEVTKHNFKEVLPSVFDAIEKCDFVAIDSEFTGLRTHDCNLSELDTYEERYTKVRSSAQKFGMIQVGLTTFRYIPDTKKYAHATFCFYTLANPGAGEIIDTSSCNFLVNNGFDFNKLFKDGIPYLSIKEEKERRQKLEETDVQIPILSPVKVTEIPAKTFLLETEAKVSAFMDDSESEELVLPGKNIFGFYRKIIYNNIGAKYENLEIQTVSTDSGPRNVVFRKFNTLAARKQFLEEQRLDKLDEKVGFTKVIRKLLECDKPIVGHNSSLDIAHLFEKTIMPLPETYEDYKKMVATNFPTLYDTKLLVKDPPFCADIPITGLEIMFNDLCEKYKPPEFEVEDGLQSFELDASSKAHNAGYDAFITGVCFITMVKRLDGPTWAIKSVVKSKHLKIFANRLNNMASYDIPHTNLGGPDVQPDRSKIFVVECLESWAAPDVYGLFHMIKSVKLVWINSTSLFVIPTEEIDLNTCRKYLKAIHASCPPLVHVRLYNDNHNSNSKRKSESENNSVSTPSNPKEFKRLKSVGASQMSEMTLESPSADNANKMIVEAKDSKNGEESKNSDGIFQVPEDW